MSELFKGVFDSDLTPTVGIGDFSLCLLSALALGLVIALVYSFRSRHTKSFVVTLALLPAVVCVVIMLVNGNIGAGVAVAGAFSLVRFRSVPGTAREICMIFLAMGTGLTVGMGYIAYAALFALVMCGIFVLYSFSGLGSERSADRHRTLKITVPEDLEYTHMFDDIFSEFTSEHRLVRVKTASMGSLFRLTYEIRLRDPDREKELIDLLRCRNGNLEISLSESSSVPGEL